MRKQRKVQLCRLREIGWAQGDRLCHFGQGTLRPGRWRSNSDEYDSFWLPPPSGLLQKSQPAETAILYLEEIETSPRYGGRISSTRNRAEATADAVAEYLASVTGRLKIRLV